MSMHTYKLDWKPEPDGLGLYYGTVQGADGFRRVDLLPPADIMPMPVILRTVKADPVLWIVFLDGVEVGRAASRREAEAALLFRLLKSNWKGIVH